MSRMRRIVAALGLVVVLSTAACGADPATTGADATNGTFTPRASTSDATGPTDSAESARAVPPIPPMPPIPTAAQLDAQIKSALDRGLPDDRRIDLVEDGEAFRSNIPDLYKAMSDNPNAKYTVVDPVFDNHDGTLTAMFTLDMDGAGTAIRTATVHFVAVDGKWKISRTDLCGVLRTADYHTQACR